MSVTDILTNALTGLTATQAGLRTVANNIANVNTPGYSRQTVALTSGVSSGGQVAGVVVGETGRIVDKYLESAVIARAGDAGRAEVTASYLDRLQSYFGATDAESGLSARIDAVTTSAQALTTVSGGTQTNIAFVDSVTDAIGSIQQLASDTSGLRADVESEVGHGSTFWIELPLAATPPPSASRPAPAAASLAAAAAPRAKQKVVAAQEESAAEGEEGEGGEVGGEWKRTVWEGSCITWQQAGSTTR